MRRLRVVDRIGLMIVRRLLPAEQRADFESELEREAESHPPAWLRRQLWSSMLPLAARLPGLLVRGTWDDARQARRALVGDARTTVLVVATLGLGLGASAVVFGVLRSAVLAPLPYPDADQLYFLRSVQPLRSPDPRGVAGPDYYDIAAALGTGVRLGAFDLTTATVSGLTTRPVKVERAATNREALEIVGISPLLGRTFSEEEDGPDASGVVLLSEALWRSAFGSDPGVLDRTLLIDGSAHSVIGVMPAEFALPSGQAALWTPLGDSPRGLHRRAPVLDVLVRVADHGRLAALNERLDVESTRLADEYPETNQGRRVRAVPLADVLAGEDGRALRVLMGAAFALMAVAFLNALGLLVSRTFVRAPELRLRSALGAGRLRVERQLFLELAAMVAAGAIVGLGLASHGLAQAASRWPPDAFRASDITLGRAVVAFVLISAGAMAVSGTVIPRLASRAFDVTRNRASRATPRPAARMGLLVAQLSTVLVLVGVSLSLVRAFAEMSEVDRGLDVTDLRVAQVDLPAHRYPTGMARYPAWPEVHGFHAMVLDELGSDPTVESVALAGSSPIRRPGFRLPVRLRSEALVDTVETAVQMVSHQWRSVLGLDLLSGRDLDRDDTQESEPVVLVNEAFRDAWLSGRPDAAGYVTYLGAERRIVGVVENVLPVPGLQAVPTVFSPLAQTPSESVTIVVRSAPGGGASDGIGRAVTAIDPELAVFGEGSVGDQLRDSMVRPALHATVLGAFGALALVIAAVGTFALVSHLTATTMRSLSVRVALGAGWPAVLRAVLRDTAAALLASLVVGCAALSMLGPAVDRLAPDAHALDPLTIGVAGLVLIAASALAAAPPAFKAVRVDPARALRSD